MPDKLGLTPERNAQSPKIELPERPFAAFRPLAPSRRCARLGWFLGVLGICVSAAQERALAMPNGVATPNCNGCHAGTNFSGEITLAPNTALEPDTATEFTLTIKDNQMKVVGFYVTTQRIGEFAADSNSGARVTDDELVHSKPAPLSNGEASIQFEWTPPTEPGGLDFEVTVVAANDDNTSGGDHAGGATFGVAWGCDAVTVYQDLDGDGYGVDSYKSTRCEASDGWALLGGDCLDTANYVHPDAPEQANSRDDDCDGQIDEDVEIATLYPDADEDGYGAANSASIQGSVGMVGYANNAEDCDDDDPAVSPGNSEACDGRDNDCNGEVDDGTFQFCGTGRCSRRIENCTDACVPGNPEPETCNGLDDDCDGETDEGELCGPGEVCDLLCKPSTGSMPSVNTGGSPSGAVASPADDTAGTPSVASSPSPAEPMPTSSAGAPAAMPLPSAAGTSENGAPPPTTTAAAAPSDQPASSPEGCSMGQPWSRRHGVHWLASALLAGTAWRRRRNSNTTRTALRSAMRRASGPR
jgi:hypothetical protein